MRKVVITSVILGLIMGLLSAQWQWAVEVAQVLSGVVQYPPANPFFQIATKGWNIFNQFAVLLISSGLSERVASYIISAMCGGLAFTAVAVFTYVLTRHAIVAMVVPFIVYFIHGNYTHGANYALGLLGTDNTYTMTSLSFIILVIALIAGGYFKSGFLLLGLAPCIHPTQGSWCVIIALITMIIERQVWRQFISRYFVYFAVGVALAFISLAVQLTFWYHPLTKKASVNLVPYYQALILFWSEHLAKFNLLGSAMMRSYLNVLLIATVLWAYKDSWKDQPRFIYTASLVTFVLGLGLSVVYWLPLSAVEHYFVLLQAYPGRILNFNNIGLTLLTLPLLWQYRQKWTAGLYLAFFLLVMLVYRGYQMENSLVPTSLVSLGVSLGAIIAIAFAMMPRLSQTMPEKLMRIMPLIYAFLAGIMVVLTVALAYQRWQVNQREYFIDYTNDVFYDLVHQRPGMILPGTGTGALDMATRRPILFNGGPAILNYVPEAAVEEERIFKNIYGVDFINPPAEVVSIGRNVPPAIVKPLWEAKTLAQWQQIKRDFHVVDIIVKKDWVLQLPYVAGNSSLSLYTIP